VFRAVENRISIARAANTGVSGFIDPFGRILGTVKKDGKDIFVDGYLIANLPLARGVTFYANHGDLFALVCVGLVLILLLLSILAPKHDEYSAAGKSHAAFL
jgi:apolipoprotein N-acyltransferase